MLVVRWCQRIPLIYKIQRGKWHLVADSDFVSFTNRGGFNLSGKWLRMWDYEGAENKAHSVAQRYWLRVFTINNGRIVLSKKRITSGVYLPGRDFASGIPPRHLPKKDDPLHEFGLSWRWWGDTGR